MEGFTEIAKALADENRARIMMFLQDRELCVCQIMKMLGLAPSTVSKHLDILYRAGLVLARKEGRWVYYDHPGRNARPEVRSAIRWLQQSLADDPQIIQDAKTLKIVSKMSLEELCCRYKRQHKQQKPEQIRARTYT